VFDVRNLISHRMCQPGIFRNWKDRIAIGSANSSAAHPSAPAAVVPYLLDLDEDNLSDASHSSSMVPASTSISIASRLCYACHTTLISKNGRSNANAGDAFTTCVPLPVWASHRLRAAD
jgi:hypothetical protein